MKNTMACTAFLMAALACVAPAAEVTEKLDRTVELEKDGGLTLGHVAGSIDLRGTAGTRVEIHAVKRVDASSEAEGRKQLAEVEIVVEKKPGSLDIQTNYDASGLLARFKRIVFDRLANKVKVDYVITVPRRTKLKVSTVSGSVTIQDVDAGVNIHGVSGTVVLTGIRGGAKVADVSGAIQASGVDGDFEATTVSGAVKAERLDGGVCAFHSTSGSLEAEVRNPRFSSATFHSVSGAVRLTLPRGAGADLAFSSVSGRLNLRPPYPATGESGGWSGKLNGGGAKVKITTVSGSCDVSEAAR